MVVKGGQRTQGRGVLSRRALINELSQEFDGVAYYHPLLEAYFYIRVRCALQAFQKTGQSMLIGF